MLMMIESSDLNETEKQIIREEIESDNSMTLMIFRFYLQANEYTFFIRRLRNVALSKQSFNQLKMNDDIVNQRKEEKLK